MTEFKTAYRPVDVDISTLSDEDKQSIFSHLESRGVVAPRKDGIIKEGAQGVASGLLQFGQGVASTLYEAGISGPKEYLQGVAERNQQLNPYPGYKASNLTDVSGLTRTIGNGVGQFMLPILVSTGASVVSGGATAPAIATGIGTSFLQIYGDEAKSYREAMPDQDPKMANTLAFISSALQAGVEVGFGPEKVARDVVQSVVSRSVRNKIADKVKTEGVKKTKKWLYSVVTEMKTIPSGKMTIVMKDWYDSILVDIAKATGKVALASGKGALGEGGEEGVQLGISDTLKSIGKGELDYSSPEEYMENIAGGAIPGALFGGAGKIITDKISDAPQQETGLVPVSQNAQEGQQSAEAVTPTNDTGEAVVTPQGAPAQATIESRTQPNLLGQHQEFTMQEGKTQTPPSREEQEFRRASLMAVGMLSKVTGANVEILDDQALATAEKSAGGQINGFHNPATGKIYINPNAPDGVVFTFGHELLHDVARKTPDVLDTFYKVLQKDLTDKGKQEIMALKERYAPIMDAIEEQNMQKLSKRDRKNFRANYVKEEFGADTLGKILEHPEAVEELAYRFELQRAGMGEKFLMQIKHFLEQAMKKLKGYISRNQAAADLFHNYEEVHDEAMKVLTKLAERNAIKNTPRLQEGQNVRTDQTVHQPEVDVTGMDEKVRKAREEQEYKAKENLELDAQIAKLEKEEAKAAETAKRRKEQEDIQSRAAEEKAARLKETQKIQENAALDKEIEKLEKEEGVAQIEKDMDLHPKTRLLDTRERKGLKQLVSRLASIPPKSLSSISPKKLGDVISAMEQNGMASGKEYALLKKVLNKIQGVSEKVTPMQAVDRQKIEPPKHESYRESVKVKTSSIKVDPARFQFKSNTEKQTGVDKSNVIGGEWDPVTAGTIYLWEDKHGNRYVVNGHHRLFLAKSQKIPYIRADIDREVDGVTEREARTKGVLMNIRDGQGQVKDYVDFIKEENIDRKTAEEQGILSRAKGRAGFNIATKAGNTLYPAYKAGQVTDAQAETIANVAEGDEGLEFAGLKMTKSMNLDELNIAMNRLKNHLAGKQHRKEQLSLFDMDDSAYKTIVATAKIISKRKNDLKQDIASIKNSVNKRERASKGGVNVTDKAEVNLREYEKQLAVLQQNVLPKELDQDILNQAVKEGLLSKDDVNISEEMDPDFPLMTKEENANDFHLVAESQKEAAAREAKGKQEELDEKERIRKKAAAATPELKFSLRQKNDIRFSKSDIYTGAGVEYEKPSLIFIGQGEGNQAFGWGLYGSDNINIAKYYAQKDYEKKSMKKNNIDYLKRVIEEEKDNIRRFMTIKESFGLSEYQRQALDRAKANIQKYQEEIDEKIKTGTDEKVYRNIYRQTFWPDKEEVLITWNKSVPHEIINKIYTALPQENLKAPQRKALEKIELWNNPENKVSGNKFYNTLSNFFNKSPQKASEFLYENGVDGVKYPASSMGRGDGSKGWNYVAFSDKDIRVDDHIRYSKVNEQDKVEAKFDQKNPVQTNEQIKQEYQDMLDNATVTKTTLPEFIRRAKDWIVRRGSIEAAAKEIVKGDTDRVLGTFISRLIMDSEQFKDLPDNLRDDVEFNYALQGSEWSMQGMARQIRNLTLDTIEKIQRVFNKMKQEASPDDWAKIRNEILEETGIDIDTLPGEIVNDKDKLDDVLTRYFTKHATKNDKAYEWWINSILSAPTTHITNILGDIGNFTYELGAKRLVETAVNTLFRRKNGPTFSEFKTMWSAFNFKEAWKKAKANSNREILTNESKLYRYHPAIGGKLGKRVRIPGRWLKFADEVFKGLIEPMETTAMAYREGVKKGLKGEALQEFIKTELNDAGSASNKYGKDQARKLTFQEDPGQFIQKLASLKNSDSMAGTVIKYLFPFISTPANIIRQGVRKSPLGIINLAGETVSAIKNKQVSDEYLGHVAEQLIAFSILGLLASGDDDDMPFITGSSAQYGSAEQRFKQNKIPPYSIRIGDKYYSYQRMDPFATGLALMVDGINAYRSAKTDKDVGKALGKFFKTSAKMISEKTYLESLGQVVEIAENPEQGIKWASSFASSWVPNVLKKFISAMDNEIRDTKSYEKGSDFLTEQMWLTAARSGLVKMAPKVDYFGREITKNQTQDMGLGDFVWNLFSPVMAVDPNLDKVERMVWKYNKANPNSQYWMSIPSPSGVVNGKKYYFSGDNYHDFAVQSGQLARKMMDEAIKKGLLNVNNPTAKDISRVKKIFTEARRITKEKFVKKRLVKFL